MKSRGPRLAKGECRAIAAALLSLLLASCTSAGDPGLNAALPGYNAGPTEFSQSAVTSEPAAVASLATTSPAPAGADVDPALPEAVAYLPSASPGTDFPVPAPAQAAAISGTTPPALETARAATEAEPAAQSTAEAEPEQQAKPQAEPAAAPQMNHPVYVTAGETPAAPQAPRKKGFLASLFGSAPAETAPVPKAAKAQPASQPAKPIITLASAEAGSRPLALASAVSGPVIRSDNALPGVRQTALFEIKRKSGLDDDSDIDLNEDEDAPYQVASAAGMARLAPNGLVKQNEGVDVACLKPSLVRVLKSIEGHYGRKLVVTSGYRDLHRNTRARGAKNSLHMYCAAADVQVPGVSKWELASYLRAMPGRGGVGTYCHTESVHVDVGPERDWNWRCRRRK